MENKERMLKMTNKNRKRIKNDNITCLRISYINAYVNFDKIRQINDIVYLTKTNTKINNLVNL